MFFFYVKQHFFYSGLHSLYLWCPLPILQAALILSDVTTLNLKKAGELYILGGRVEYCCKLQLLLQCHHPQLI